MKKSDKIKIELHFRSQEIVELAKIAQDLFNIYKKEPSLNHYRTFKKMVDNFYNDANETYLSGSSLYVYDQQKSMLKSFKTIYPKQYKIIVKELEENGINYMDLVNYTDKGLEYLEKQQKDRMSTVVKLNSNLKSNEQFSMRIINDAFSRVYDHIIKLENIESDEANPKFNEVDYINLFNEKLLLSKQKIEAKINKNAKIVEKLIARNNNNNINENEKDTPELTR